MFEVECEEKAKPASRDDADRALYFFMMVRLVVFDVLPEVCAKLPFNFYQSVLSTQSLDKIYSFRQKQ